MGLSTALNSASSGLTSAQSGLDIVARNVANAATDGYVRKSRLPVSSQPGVSAGVVRRHADAFVQSQLRTENSAVGEMEAKSSVLNQAAELLGTPGGWGLSTLYSEFSSSLQSLTGSPQSSIKRKAVVTAAQNLASEIRSVGSSIQQLRRQTESQISAAVTTVNSHLTALAQTNTTLGTVPKTSVEYAELLDTRDHQINEISKYLNINTTIATNGIARVYSPTGETLVDGTARQLSFDARLTLQASDRYSADSAKRGVGTISIDAASNDILASGIGVGGRIGGYVSARDADLVEMYDRLDAMAAGIAKALSDVEVQGSAATSAGTTGFDLDVSSLASGDTINVVSNTTAGLVQTHTFLRVDSAASLPLDPTYVARFPGSTSVTGIDFSGGAAAAAAAIQTALGGDVTVAASGSTLQFRQPTTAGSTRTATLVSTGAVVTQNSNTGSVAMPLFVDSSSGGAFFDSVDGQRKRLGFAERITVNTSVVKDASLLVKHSATAGEGDPARPLALLNRLQNAGSVFSSKNPEHTDGTVLQGTVQDYISNTIAVVSQSAQTEAALLEGRKTIKSSLESRHTAEAGVNVDREIANLIDLQSSFAANARVISIVRELMLTLMKI